MFEDKSGRIKIFQLHKNNIQAIDMGGFSYNVLVVISIFFIFISYCVNAYAQLADTMLCADESCSETISEGEARLAYRPRDKNFLDLKKGQVVLVKSKNAGKKTHLWGGQDFLKGRTSEDSADESFSHLVAEKQKITFEKSKKIDEQKQQQIADNENRKSPPVEEAVKVVTADSRTKEVDDIDNSQLSEDIQTTKVRSFVEESSDPAAETFEPEDRIKLHDDQLKVITDSVGKQKDDDSMNAIPDIGKTIIDTKISNSDSDNGNIATNIPSDIAALLGEDQTFKKDITTSDSVIVKTKEISAADKSDIINTDNQDIAAKVDAPTDTVDEDDRKKNDDHGDDTDSGGQSDEQEKASASSDDSNVGPADKFHEKSPQSVPVSEEFVEEYGEATQDNDEVVEEKKTDDIIAEDVLTAKGDDEETRESEKDSLDKNEVDEQGFKQMPENVPHTSESIKSNDDQPIKNNMEHEYYESHKVSQTGSNSPVTLPSDNQEGTTELHQEANIEDYQESHQHEYDESTKNELITDIEKKNSENQLQGNNIGKNEKSGSEKHMQDKSLAEQEMADHGNVSDQEENPHLAEVNQNDLDKNENSDNGQVTTSKVQAKAQEMESSLEDVITDHGIHTKIEDTQSSRENANPNEIQEESRNEDNIIQENDISTITPEEEVKQLVSENTQLEVIDDESETKKHLTEPPEYHAHSEDSVEREGSLKKTIDTTQDTRPENDSEISSTNVHTDGEHDEKYSNGDSSNPTHKDGEHDEKDFIGDPSTSTHTDGKHDEKIFNGASSTSSRTDVEHGEKDFNGDYSARTNAEHDSNIGSSTSAHTDGEHKHDTDDVPHNIKKDSEPEDGRDEFRDDLQIQQMDTESQQSDDQSSDTKFSKVSGGAHAVDPLLRWFFPQFQEKCAIGMGVDVKDNFAAVDLQSEEIDDDNFDVIHRGSVFYSMNAHSPYRIDDPFLRRTLVQGFENSLANQKKNKLISSFNRSEKCNDEFQSDQMKPSDEAILKSLNLVNDPFLLRTIPVNIHHIDKILNNKSQLMSDSKMSDETSTLHDDTLRHSGLNNIMHDKLVHFSDIKNSKSLRVVDNPFLEKSILVRQDTTEIYNDSIKKCKKTHSEQVKKIHNNINIGLVITEKSTFHFNDDPRLKWFIPRAQQYCKMQRNSPTDSTRDDASSRKPYVGHSSYLSNPLLRLLLAKAKTPAFSHRTLTSSHDSEIEPSDTDFANKRGCSSYNDDPMLRLILKNLYPYGLSLPLLKNGPHGVNINDDVGTDNSNVEEMGNECSSYFDNPLLKWILFSNPEYKTECRKREWVEAISYEKNPYEDDIEYESAGIGKDEDIENAEFSRPIIVQTQQSLEAPAWTLIRILLSSFQDLHEDTFTLRAGVADIMKDMKTLKKVKPEMAWNFHKRAKTFKQDVITLEDQIYSNIQFLTKQVYRTSMSKQEQTAEEETVIPKYRGILAEIATKIDTLQDEMRTIHDAILEEMYDDSDVIDKEKDEERIIAYSEIQKLQEKLDNLYKKIDDKDYESNNLLSKMEKEAEIFKSRIADLEQSISERNDDAISKLSEQRENELAEKLAEFQTSIKEKSNEQIKAAKAETKVLKEKLEELEASLKLSVEADKPFKDRVATLEKELTMRKNRDIENAKKEKFEATLLRSKIQALERQLKKKINPGNTKMLIEAKELKEKVKNLEKSLIENLSNEKRVSFVGETEEQMKERISALESELQQRLKSIDISAKNEITNELKARVQAMEEKLKLQLQQLDVRRNETSSGTNRKRDPRVKGKRKKLEKQEIMKLINTFFFQNNKIEKDESVYYTNQTEVVSPIILHNVLENVNPDLDFKCIVEPAKRRACGAKHFSRNFCSALQCCWSPVESDPDIPPCYFSLLQMENPDNKDIRDQPLNKAMKEESIEKYDTLHEGKVVNWDETLEEKPNEKHVGWDELLGAENDSPTVSPTSETGNEVGNGLKVIERYDNPEDEATSTPTTHQSSDQMKKSTELHTETAPVLAQTKNVFDEEQPIKLKETTTTTPIEFSQQSNPSQQYDDQPKNDLHETAEKNKSEEASSPDVNSKVAHDEINPQKDDTIAESVTKFQDEDDDLHVESFSLRLLLIFSKLPTDIIYIMEPLFAVWVSLLPEEYQKDVYGVSWTIIFSTSVIGFILIWLLICRSRSVKRAYKDQHTATTIQELKTQLENLSQEKIEVENELRTKQNEVEIQKEQMASVMEEKNTGAAARRGLEHSLREHNEENEALKREMQILNQNLLDKDHAMQEVLSNSQRIEKSLVAQQEAISKYESEAEQLRRLISKYENDQKSSEGLNDKLKEKIKALEKAKGETKKEGKTLKDQIEKLNNKIGELQENLDNEIEDGEARKQEIDVLKDCILQFKGVQEYLNDEDEDIDTEEAMIKQKEKMKSMIDVANVKNVLRQSEAEKLQVTYELEAERKSRQDTEGKVSELEATIQGNEAMKNKLEREKQMLESKLTVMQEFYAKREVEIQSKLGLEQSKRESNASLLEDQQQQRLELLQQLDAYKKMGEDAKRKYEDSERQHKQEILGFEKKSHDNWLACRDSERKTEEANKQISQLQLELTDLRRRLHDSQDREPIIRPRPERHGPPGAPPSFGPPRRGPPPPGVPGSPLHFRSGPPDADRRSPPLNRRPPSPGGSIPGDRPPSRPDRPPSRPDRPPSTHSLPPLDRRSMPGPPSGPGQPYTNTPPGREFRPYRDGMPPMRPPPRDLPPHARPPPPSGPRSGPSSSPYMDRPPIPSSQGYFTQSSLHATPPQSTGDGLRNDGNQPPPPSSGSSAGPPPPGAGPHGGSNPFRRSGMKREC